DRAARAALADDGGDQRHLDLETGLDGARDRLGLAARLGVDAGIGARGVDERQNRQTEMIRQLHQAPRLAIALGPRHAEIVPHARIGVGALFMRDHHHRLIAEPAEPADNGAVLGEGAVARERREIGDQPVDDVEPVRPVGMTRDLHLLPRRQPGIDLVQLPVELGLEPLYLVGDVEIGRVRQMPQLLDLVFELGDGFFEIEIVFHRRPDASAFFSTAWAWRIEAASIMRPSSVTAPRPCRCASSSAATIRCARSISAACGVKTSLASAICDGWIAHLPSMPIAATRDAAARNPSGSWKSANGPSIGRSPLARAATTMRDSA